MICVLAGGVGAARLLSGLQQVWPAEDITAVVNVSDDLVLHGLHISPDLDTVTYTLADATDPDRGWGLRDETWNAMETLGQLGGTTWFNLGDRDLGTHLLRTGRLNAGAPLSEVTAEIAAGWGVQIRLLPATDDPIRTFVTVAESAQVDTDKGSASMQIEIGSVTREVPFQEYFVKERHAVPVVSLRFEGAEAAQPGPGVIDAINNAELVVIAPSNPLVSIAPVLAVPGIREAVAARRADTVAVSPIIAGAALKGPADRMMKELGYQASAVGVAKIYAELASTLIVDTADADLVEEIQNEHMTAVATPTVMSDPARAAALGRAVLRAGNLEPSQ